MSPEQIELIIRNTIGTEVQRFLLLAVLLAAVVALIAAYLASYLQTKGTHRALREELQTLTAQVSATTKAAEEIKAQIGQSTWVGQRRWEFKRELYTDLMEALYRILNINETIFDLYIHKQGASDEHRAFLEGKMTETKDQEQPHLDELIRVRGIGELIFTKDTIAALDELNKEWTENRHADDYFDFLDNRVAATRKAHEKIVAAARRDLEL